MGEPEFHRDNPATSVWPPLTRGSKIVDKVDVRRVALQKLATKRWMNLKVSGPYFVEDTNNQTGRQTATVVFTPSPRAS